MTRRTIHTFVALATLAVVSLAVVSTALAQEDEGGEIAEVTETTDGFAPGTEPAVVISTSGADEDEAAWTFRYLVPTLLVLSGLALAGLFVWYGLGIKGRYRVVR